MLDESTNRLLTQVGAGTPMGELLRRYWHPIAALDELDREPVRPVRLMGEDLVLYKDLNGTLGLVGRHCLHRGADLAHGYVEQGGLRCHYHGWLYNEAGRCAHQPFEEVADPRSATRNKLRATAYPVEAKAGMIWAYLGPPDRRPLLPDWEPFSWRNGFVQVVFADVPCNWFQCQENSIDPVHFEWAHANWSLRQRGEASAYSPRHLKLAFEEFEYGFVYRRVREDTDESHPLWSVGRVCLWPNAFFLGDHFEWRVPVDDENTLSVAWFFVRVPKGREPYVQNSVPTWKSPIRGEDGRWITSHVINQDIVAWVGQGRIADRTQEHLRSSDIGITMMRNRFFEEMEAIRQGREPKGVIRDPMQAKAIDLPDMARELNTAGLTLAEFQNDPLLRQRLKEFRHHYGQPPEVRAAFAEAMGIATT